jgi:PRC-barrel domain
MTQLPDESLFGDYGEWPGRDVLDSGGERLGGVREIYLDRETGQPEWVLVDVDGGEARFVPLADAAVESTTIRVAHAATVIRNAPGIGSEPRIDQSEERRLYQHYGLGYSDDDSGSGLPTDEAPTMEHQAFGAPQEDTNGTTSWSDVAPSDTPDAPPPAEPPSATEIEKADIPDPPAMSAPEPATSYDTPGEPATTDFDTHSPPDRSAFEPPREPEPPAATPEPFTASLDQPEATVPVTPDVIPPPAPAEPVAEAPRATWTPPPPEPEEPSGGPLAVIKSRKGGIAAGIAVAAVLLFIIRRLR